jgi:hypothetical protein
MFVGCGEPRTSRELLLHVMKEFAPINHSNIDNADKISLSVVQHIDEFTIGGSKKALTVNASRNYLGASREESI